MLLTARDLSKSFGPRLLFSGITLGLQEDDCVGLIGANGSGKSTLLRIFAGAETPDTGQVVARRLLRVGYVQQEDAFDAHKCCVDVVADAMDPSIDEHERHLTASLALDRAGFVDPTVPAGTLSGGWRKRLAIVQQLSREPELLLIDEPTNHLDVEGILWLEDVISNASFATLTVSHDRRFLESVVTRIIELGRQYPEGYLSHQGSYTEFLEKKDEFLAAQESREKALASGVRREIEWLRRGAKARTTKAKGRIERAGEMISELADVRQRNVKQGAAGVEFLSSDRKTRKLVELKNVSKSRGGKTLFTHLNVTLAPGKKLGLLGPNGSGKSSLIKLLTGQLGADSGEVFLADSLKIIVFDQHREQLDDDQTLRRALSPTGDNVDFQGQSMHISGWARKFLFRTEQLDLPLSQLSGGEKARVLIARLMLRPADVLVLDEPTNDLDIPTLDVLEESLEEFPGAIILVTHDRYLMDRVATDILALDGHGGAHVYADLSQWERGRITNAKARAAAASSKSTPAKSATLAPGHASTVAKGTNWVAPSTSTPSLRKRLAWSEQKELDTMEATIHDAEAKVATLHALVEDPAVIADHTKIHDAYDRLGLAQREVERLYARWAELEAKM